MAENNGVAGRVSFPRRWEAGRLFWSPVRQANGTVGLGLSGTGNPATARTKKASEDLRILAGITDVDASLVTIKDGSEQAVWSNQDTLIKQLFGKKRLSRNYYYYKPPFTIREGNHLMASALGAGGETGGNLVFLCDPVKAEKKTITIPENAHPFSLVLSAGLAGDASERKTVETAASRDKHTLVWGGGSDLAATSIRIKDDEGQYWMDDAVPVWSVFADPNSASQVITQLWPRPYYIPPGGSLSVEFYSPASGQESNGFIYFNCARW